MTRILAIAAAVAVVMASLGIFASPAAAHETRAVGPYTFVVGWVAEPAIAGQSNGLDLTVTETAGDAWLDPDWFRLGASSLLNDCLMQLAKEKSGAYQSGDYFTID